MSQANPSVSIAEPTIKAVPGQIVSYQKTNTGEYIGSPGIALLPDGAYVASHDSPTLCRVGRHGSAFIKGLACALSESGICDDFMAEPFHRFREPERTQVSERPAELGLLREAVRV